MRRKFANHEQGRVHRYFEDALLQFKSKSQKSPQSKGTAVGQPTSKLHGNEVRDGDYHEHEHEHEQWDRPGHHSTRFVAKRAVAQTPRRIAKVIFKRLG